MEMKIQIIIIAALVAVASAQQNEQQNVPALGQLNGMLSSLTNGGASGILQAPRNFLASALQNGAQTLGPNGQLYTGVDNFARMPLNAMSRASSMMSQMAQRLQGGQPMNGQLLNGLPGLSDLQNGNLFQGLMPNGNNQGSNKNPLQEAMGQMSHLMPSNLNGANSLTDSARNMGQQAMEQLNKVVPNNGQVTDALTNMGQQAAEQLNKVVPNNGQVTDALTNMGQQATEQLKEAVPKV